MKAESAEAGVSKIIGCFLQGQSAALLAWHCCCGGLTQPQVFERRVRVSTANIGDDYQFQYFHTCEVDLIVLNFACRLRGTEVPLLPHDFAKALIGF